LPARQSASCAATLAFELFGSRPEAMPEPLIVEMVDADRER